MSMPVLATKLYAPAQRGRLVSRARLMGRLDALLEPGERVGLLSAPAGFGKTTLASAWSAAASARPRQLSVAWVSLDEDDNDLGRLLAHVLAALDGAGAPLGVDHAAGTANPMDLPGANAVLTAVVNRLVQPLEAEGADPPSCTAATGEVPPSPRWLLVLDDYHVITSADVHQAVTFLLDHQPEQLRVLIATRSDPPLPVARLRSRGQLVEVRAADLRFTHEEAGDFLNDVMQLDLDHTQVEALDDRTEGWATGLQLAGLSLRGRTAAADVSAFVADFAGSNRFVVDYLADEVLARQPPQVRSFLLRTSVLDRLTGLLCDAVTGTSGAAQMLDRLDRENLFVVPLDEQRTWYRYHHLFADVLRARLRAQEPDTVADLHCAASDWYAEHGLVEDAARHAFAAPDYVRAGRLVERGLAQLRRDRRDAVLLTWLRSMPDDVVRPNPVLSAAAGWAAMVAGDLAQFERHLDDADAALAAAARDPASAAGWEDTDDLRAAAASVHLYRAALAQARGDRAGTEAHARAALDLADPDDHFVRGGGGGFLGLAAWARGEIEEGLATFGQAATSLRAAGNHVDALDTTIVLADMWVTAGDPSRARELCEQALAAATAHGEPYPRATADLHTSLAELALGRGDLAAAGEELRTAAVLAERAHITENRHRWPTVTAWLRAASGDYPAAFAWLEEAAGSYRAGFYPDLRPLAAVKARVALLAGDLTLADRWVAQSGVGLGDEPEFVHEYEQLTLARVVLAHHRTSNVATDGSATGGPGRGGLAEVVDLLERLDEAATREARRGSVLEIRMLKGLVLSAQGEDEAAVQTLASALEATPEVDGYLMLFRDAGPAMSALLDQVASREPDEPGPATARAQRLLKLSRARAGRTCAEEQPTLLQQPAERGAVSPLSEREQEVLRLLQSELSGPEIAGQLYISLNTLRTHTKRIFTKLDVTSRAAAVRRGRELHLI